MDYFNFFLWFSIALFLETYIILRIINIKKEIKETWKIKNKWIVENLFEKEIQKDLHERVER